MDLRSEGKLVRAKHTEDLEETSALPSTASTRFARDVAGLRLPEPDPTPSRWRTSSAISSSTSPASTSPPSGRPKRLATTSPRTGSSSLRTIRVLSLPGSPSAAQQADAVRSRRGSTTRTAPRQGGWMEFADGVERRVSRRSRIASRPAGDARYHAQMSGGSTTASSGRRPSCRSTRTTFSSTAPFRTGRRGRRSLCEFLFPSRRSRWPISIRLMRSRSGT